ncbi:MAG: hypothetical protein CLLPBCKN_004846 [Chroococcidiopsis cubana SAG 39.79]|nr:hypothetical protein [Chroococcidiopsis cubana SAG 39.79]
MALPHQLKRKFNKQLSVSVQTLHVTSVQSCQLTCSYTPHPILFTSYWFNAAVYTYVRKRRQTVIHELRIVDKIARLL